MTELERYILQNRDQLEEVESPPDPSLIWMKVSQEVHPGRKPVSVRLLDVRKYVHLAIAASVGLLIGVGMWQFLPQGAGNYGSKELSAAAYFPELAEREGHYQKVIAQKELEIGMDKIDRKQYQDIFTELSLLEAFREEYLQDLGNAPSDDELIETLIRFYERKVRILERLNNEVAKRNHHEKNFNERSL